MKGQANAGYLSDDVVQTPPEMCELVARHFLMNSQPRSVREPCCGQGNFLQYLRRFTSELHWNEISRGYDFYNCHERTEWIVTNPPWSLLAADSTPMSFLEKALQMADNVVFILTLNHAFGLKSRFNWCEKYGFGVPEVLLLDTPPAPWPDSGFQLGAVLWQRGYPVDGPTAWPSAKGGAVPRCYHPARGVRK